MKKIKISLIIIIMFLFIININKINAVEELPDDGGRISSSQVIQTKTGTGPFDENDEPGNDSSEDNNIVRSFDQVTWTVENTMVLNGNEADSYSGGRIYFEAVLPDVFTSETAKWDLNSMKWIENAQVSNDGLTLTGYYQMSSDNITVPGKQSLVFVTKILGAANGIKFQPTIKLWLNGNSKENYKIVTTDNITISAAPSYNIKFVRNDGCNKRTTVDYGNGETQGRMYGYWFVLQLYGDNSSKGLKGIEYPKGDITFDIDMKMERTIFGSTQREDITDNAQIVLWNYKVNTADRNGNISDRTMYFGNSSQCYGGISSVLGKIETGRNNSIYNSGNILMTQENPRKLKVTISEYAFDGIFPKYNHHYNSSSAAVYGDNIGCFSAGYFQIFVPDTESVSLENRNYYLSVNDSNFNAMSISGQNTTEQKIKTDDSSVVTYVKYTKGSYEHHLYLWKKETGTLMTSINNIGDAFTYRGVTFYLRSYMAIGGNNDSDIYEIDRFVKFDGEGYEFSTFSDGSIWKTSSDMGDMKFKAWYITKKDGSNWESQEEMNSTRIHSKNLDFYESLNQIPDNKICIGIYFESISGKMPPPPSLDRQYFNIALKMKDTATIGKTYGITQDSRYWEVDLDRNKYSQVIGANYEDYPDAVAVIEGRNYIKTEYDENGSIISGTHSGNYRYGQTVLVVGATQSVKLNSLDNITNSSKTNFDLGKNENIVKYNIEPSITNDSKQGDINGITLLITDTLPKGLTYVAGSSNYGEPDITVNLDGTTTLKWNINNCSVNKKIDALQFEANIDEDSPNGTQYENKVVIGELIKNGEETKIGNTNISLRTATNTIQIVNLSSHRLYKSVDTPVIEKNGEIHFTVSYKNNTDEIIKDFQMLDILPYNGDSRGTNYTGDYTLDRLVVTQTNEAGDKISNDNLQILYTNDESVRNGITSKDENLGQGWNSINSETIKQKATAYVVKGEIGAQGSVTVDIYLKTNGNKGLDKYVNSATAQVYKETEEMVTSNVVSQVVERSIEGIAWEDSNRNGVKDEGEQVLSNVEINLTDALGQQVTDVNGNKVTSIKTDNNGYYKFENLPKGEYYVQVKIPNEKYELTEKQVGTNNEINSKFNEEEKETDKIEGLNSIDLPELKVSYVNAGFVKIEGSIEITKVDKEDNSKLIEGATFKIEKLDDKGNIDSTYSIEEQTTDKEGKVKFQGLEVGKYRVTETKAPSGYELLEKSIEVEITGENRDIKLTAENELKLILPLTGDTNNTIGLIIIGAIMIGISVILFVKYEGKVLIQKA